MAFIFPYQQDFYLNMCYIQNICVQYKLMWLGFEGACDLIPKQNNALEANNLIIKTHHRLRNRIPHNAVNYQSIKNFKS